MTYTLDTSHKSPNHSSRGGADISMLVLHATVGSYAASLSWLCNPASKVSIHYLIRKDGHIAWLVDDSRAAWHAGVSAWYTMDSEDIMNASIGIELENANNGRDPYPPTQVDALLWLCRPLVAKYAIAPVNVVRHLDIAIPDGRKTDPAGFAWAPFKAALFQPTTQAYRAVTCAPVFQDRKPDAVLAGAVGAGTVEQVDDVTSGWLHLASGFGFSPLSCWEVV